MRAVCTRVMLEIFIYTKHIFNQSPYDEVANLAKKNLLLQFSDYRSAIFHFVGRRRRKIGSVYNKTLSSAIVSQLRGYGWRDANITYTSAIAPSGDYRQGVRGMVKCFCLLQWGAERSSLATEMSPGN